MKKLLFVLLIVALASYLFVGCTPGGTVTPVIPVVAGIDCPTKVEVSGEVVIGTKTYIKGGTSKTITVTFAVATAPVSVYVGEDIDDKAAGLVPSTADEVIMYTTDNKVYTGTYTFKGLCATDYIYVETCGTCAACKYPYTVDSLAPTAAIRICAADCVSDCGGCAITFTSATTTAACATGVDCVEKCSGFASWKIDIYDKPLGACCTTACGGTLIGSGSGTTCPINWTTACLGLTMEDLNFYYGWWKTVYAYVTLADNVGNSRKFGYGLELQQEYDWVEDVGYVFDTCSRVIVTDLDAIEDCLEQATHTPCTPCIDITVDITE